MKTLRMTIFLKMKMKMKIKTYRRYIPRVDIYTYRGGKS